MQPAQFVPIVRMRREIGLCLAFPVLADRGQLAPVLFALFRKGGVGSLRIDQQIADSRAKRRRLARIGAGAQEYPAAFAPSFGQTRVAQDADVPRHARLALPQHLRDFTHCQLHRAKQAHDPEPGRIGKGAEEVFGSHCEEDIKIFLYL
jgi:hypothetical protein